MIKLEFGDAMRRLRDGETLMATHPKLPPQTMVWDARGLWTYTPTGKWKVVKNPLELIMRSTWYLNTVEARAIPPLPMGPCDDNETPLHPSTKA
jgi:hypothetical protein